MVSIHLKKSKCDQFGAGVDIILGRLGQDLCMIIYCGLGWGGHRWPSATSSLGWNRTLYLTPQRGEGSHNTPPKVSSRWGVACSHVTRMMSREQYTCNLAITECRACLAPPEVVDRNIMRVTSTVSYPGGLPYDNSVKDDSFEYER